MNESRFMENPSDAFNTTISDKTKSTLNQQIEMNNHIIEYVGIRQENFDIIQTKLLEFKFLYEQMPDVKLIEDAYKDAVNKLIQYVQQKFNKSKEQFDEVVANHANVLGVDSLQKAHKNFKTIQ